MCVFFPFILEVKFVGCTSRGHTDRRKVTQEFSSTFLLRCMPFFFSREGFSRCSFPSSTVELNFVFKEKSFVSKKNQNAPRPSEHPPVRGGNIKTF